MKALLPYVREIEEHVGTWPRSWEGWASWSDVCLDGGPSRALREAAPLAHRKALGAFFTGSELGWRAALAAGPPSDDNTVYFDPVCGAGGLLLAAPRQLAGTVFAPPFVAVRRTSGPRDRSRATDAWLNRRIRCRHLTTSAVAGIPWWDEP